MIFISITVPEDEIGFPRLFSSKGGANLRFRAIDAEIGRNPYVQAVVGSNIRFQYEMFIMLIVLRDCRGALLGVIMSAKDVKERQGGFKG
jgi:hypothetical protein